MKNQRKGFTLLELLIVIAVIGLLSTVAVVALNQARAKGRNTKRVGDIKAVHTALELYYAENKAYPAMATATEIGTPTRNKLCGAATFSSTCVGKPFLEKVPKAPVPQDGACTTVNNPYMYQSVAPFSTYSLNFCLGGQTGVLGAGLHTADPGGIR